MMGTNDWARWLGTLKAGDLVQILWNLVPDGDPSRQSLARLVEGNLFTATVRTVGDDKLYQNIGTIHLVRPNPLVLLAGEAE